MQEDSMIWLYFLLGGFVAPLVVLLLVVIAATRRMVNLHSMLRFVGMLRVIMWFSTMFLWIAAWINFQFSTAYGMGTLVCSFGLILPQMYLNARIRKSQSDPAPTPELF